MDDNKEGVLDLTNIKPIVFENCEWCFQFDNDEPYVFAATEKPEEPAETPKVTFTVLNNSNSNIIFSYNGKEFKIFARELSDEGRKLIKNN